MYWFLRVYEHVLVGGGRIGGARGDFEHVLLVVFDFGHFEGSLVNLYPRGLYSRGIYEKGRSHL